MQKVEIRNQKLEGRIARIEIGKAKCGEKEKADPFRQGRNLTIGCACHGRPARDDRWMGSTLGRGRAEARPYNGKGKRKKSGHNVPAVARNLRYCAPTRQESEIRTQKLEIRKSKLVKREEKRDSSHLQAGVFAGAKTEETIGLLRSE